MQKRENKTISRQIGTVNVPSLKNYDKDSFQQFSTDRAPILLRDNVSVAWDNFKTTSLNIANTMAPVKQIRIKQRTKQCATAKVVSSSREIDKAFNSFRHSKQLRMKHSSVF